MLETICGILAFVVLTVVMRRKRRKDRERQLKMRRIPVISAMDPGVRVHRCDVNTN